MNTLQRKVVIVRTGGANLASVSAAFERLGAPVRISEHPADVRAAAAVVLPGVGAFGPAMERLRANGLGAALVERIEAGQPLLCVCLGLQLLFEESDEAPGVRGLGILPGRVGRFESSRIVPHMGWNRVQADPAAEHLRDGYAYFAHSFRVTGTVPGARIATCAHGERFVAAFEHGSVTACQFHPELSGGYGRALLASWWTAIAAEEAEAC